MGVDGGLEPLRAWSLQEDLDLGPWARVESRGWPCT